MARDSLKGQKWKASLELISWRASLLHSLYPAHTHTYTHEQTDSRAHWSIVGLTGLRGERSGWGRGGGRRHIGHSARLFLVSWAFLTNLPPVSRFPPCLTLSSIHFNSIVVEKITSRIAAPPRAEMAHVQFTKSYLAMNGCLAIGLIATFGDAVI